jgi:hypothetical protein
MSSQQQHRQCLTSQQADAADQRSRKSHDAPTKQNDAANPKPKKFRIFGTKTPVDYDSTTSNQDLTTTTTLDIQPLMERPIVKVH